jgi:hypothetical protein
MLDELAARAVVPRATLIRSFARIGSVSVSGKRDFGGRDNGVETVRHIQPIVSRDKRPHENPPVRRYLHDTGKSLFA